MQGTQNTKQTPRKKSALSQCAQSNMLPKDKRKPWEQEEWDTTKKKHGNFNQSQTPNAWMGQVPQNASTGSHTPSWQLDDKWNQNDTQATKRTNSYKATTDEEGCDKLDMYMHVQTPMETCDAETHDKQRKCGITQLEQYYETWHAKSHNKLSRPPTELKWQQ